MLLMVKMYAFPQLKKKLNTSQNQKINLMKTTPGVKTKSTVSCSDGKCTVTELQQQRFYSAFTGVSGTSTVYSEADFCQKNPASGVCTGTGTGRGD